MLTYSAYSSIYKTAKASCKSKNNRQNKVFRFFVYFIKSGQYIFPIFPVNPPDTAELITRFKRTASSWKLVLHSTLFQLQSFFYFVRISFIFKKISDVKVEKNTYPNKHLM